MATLRNKTHLTTAPSFGNIKYETRPEGFFPFIFCADCKKSIENLDAIAGWNDDGQVAFAHNACADNFEYAEDLISFFHSLLHNTNVSINKLQDEANDPLGSALRVSADRTVQPAQTTGVQQ